MMDTASPRCVSLPTPPPAERAMYNHGITDFGHSHGITDSGNTHATISDIAKAPSGVVASAILREAADIVTGDRNTTHGDKERSFAAIAAGWNWYASTRLDPRAPLSAFDVAQMMVLLKMGRANQGKHVRDHFLDQAGYSAIAGELA